MKLLLDEDVPVQVVEPLRRLLREDQVDHVQGLGLEVEGSSQCRVDAVQLFVGESAVGFAEGAPIDTNEVPPDIEPAVRHADCDGYGE